MAIGRQLLYDDAGRRRPDGEVRDEVGDLGLRTALLADAVHRRAREDEPPSSPPHAVISHAQAAPDDLAGFLTALGWTVQVEPRRAEPMTVAEFEAGVARCRLFVAVLTASARSTWEEIQVAMSLPYVHTLAITDGASEAGGPIAFDRVIRGDYRPHLHAELSRHYRYRGGTLPAGAERMIRREARTAAQARPGGGGGGEGGFGVGWATSGSS
jgi:hypothetical protein